MQSDAVRHGRANNGAIVCINHGLCEGDAQRIVLSSRHLGCGEFVDPMELPDQQTKRHGHHETINGLYEKVIERRKMIQEFNTLDGALPNAINRFDLDRECRRNAMGPLE